MTELKGEMDQSTIRVGDLNIPFSVTDRKGDKKIRKGIDDVTNTLNQYDLIDIYKILIINRCRIYILIKDTLKTKQDRQILDHKTSPPKFQKLK